MKKFRGLLFTLLFVSALLVTGCKNKTVISADEFKQKMEEKQYSVDDLTDMFADNNTISKVYIATNTDTTYQIAFYELIDTEVATNFYNQNKETYESNKSSGYKTSNVDLKNYSKYTLEDNGAYKVLSRVDNTLIMLNVKSDYKDAVNDILKELGY